MEKGYELHKSEAEKAFENCLNGIKDCFENITEILGFQDSKTAMEEHQNIIKRQNSCFSHIENEINKMKYFLDFRENLKLQIFSRNAVAPTIKED